MDKKTGFRRTGLGVGYVSVMIIFAIICLTIFAVFSIKAASSNDAFNERSGGFLKQYYAADSEAKLILARLDECAYNARLANPDKNAENAVFVGAFELSANGIEGVVVSSAEGGCAADYSVKINDRQELAVEVVFYAGGGFEITRWQSVTVSGGGDDSHINVWDGEAIV